MVRNLPLSAPSSAIAGFVRELLEEERRRALNERRSVHRNPFVRPVAAMLRDQPDEQRHGFAKNISPLGIGVILDGPIDDGAVVRLIIHRFNVPPTPVICECRWCDPFGPGWYHMGFHFLTLSGDLS